MFKQKILPRILFLLFFISFHGIYINCFTFLTNNLLHRQVHTISSKIINNPISPFQCNLTTHKYNRTSLGFSANLSITENIDKRYQLTLELQKWGDGGWKRNALIYKNNDPCKQLKLTLGPVFQRIMDFLKHPPNCPFRPGFYHFEEFGPTNDEGEISPIFLNLGRHKLIIDFLKNDVWLNRYEQELDIREVNY